jgi:hypothetical protein
VDVIAATTDIAAAPTIVPAGPMRDVAYATTEAAPAPPTTWRQSNEGVGLSSVESVVGWAEEEELISSQQRVERTVV